MKPRNKFQQRIVEASKKLTALTDEQIEWSKNNVIGHLGRRNNKGKITCTNCTHSWQGISHLIDTLTDCECPNCKAKLKVKTTNKRVFRTNYYMTIITACEGYQVIRSIIIRCTARTGKLPEYTHSEVMQRWLAPDGKFCTFAKLRQTMGTMYYDAWIDYTPLELRQENDVYDRIFTDCIYPHQQLIPELRRTGYKKALYNQKPLALFRTLLTDSKAETLVKAKQTKLLKRIMDMGWKNIDNYWRSIKICLRNNYKITDATLWCDYIDLLRFFGKDLSNTKYVCPDNLKAEHDRYVAKKLKADLQAEIEKQLEKEADYREAKAKFFGLVFSDGTINIRVLESIAEIITEGKVMHHCVGSYHSKEDSLILSATIKGKRIETIEISISQLKLIQSRGVCNKNTKYHNQIINLVNQNLSLIEERLVA
ncbi:PcfJ domain-containing protein [Bacteroides reticulotermitis]|uniref:PcfJ domain-containing protein n=1 Tax=Bacteroides reticulotermitis TaxID=1133319 RepID=UPI003A84790C